MTNAVVPVATAVLGAAAGALLGRRRRRQRRKVLGVPIPGTGADGLEAVARSVSDAGKQFGKLADEIKTGRQKAEQISRALS